MPITDEEAAATAIASFVSLSPAQQEAYSQITAILASGDEDSFVDTIQLFELYNTLYFNDKLLPRAQLSWSPRLTLCAGTCELTRDPETKRYTHARVKLSEPLLKLRPRSDLLNTLLHECIHAYLFVTSNFAHVRDPTGGHGAGFQALSAAINSHGGYAITQFHQFHDEVDSYRTHIWLCKGSCRTRPPFFGLVKRAMNRAPSKSDSWWKEHERECGGMFEKIAEPEMPRRQLEGLSGFQRAGRQKNKIDQYVSGDKISSMARDDRVEVVGGQQSIKSNGNGPLKRKCNTEVNDVGDVGDVATAAKITLVACPVCNEAVKDIYINEHLDKIHNI